MRASRNAQLAGPAYERSESEAWQQARLELLKPQQKQRRAKRRREALAYGFLGLLLFSLAFAYMFLESRINVAGREVNDLQVQIDETNKLALRTELEIGNLSSLSRIESYATLHLGMVYPNVKSVQYLSQQVSAQLNADLLALTVTAQEEEEKSAPEEERYPLFVAWSELIGHYFTGTALAVEE